MAGEGGLGGRTEEKRVSGKLQVSRMFVVYVQCLLVRMVKEVVEDTEEGNDGG